jgi:hypothetical protein
VHLKNKPKTTLNPTPNNISTTIISNKIQPQHAIINLTHEKAIDKITQDASKPEAQTWLTYSESTSQS